MNEKTAVTREAQAALLPPVDVIEDTAGITLYADLPGVSRDMLNLHLEAGTLTIEGEVALPLPGEMEASHAEVSLPRYRRAFTLSNELDPQNLSAEIKHGVLKVRIQKVEQAKPRRIPVNAA